MIKERDHVLVSGNNRSAQFATDDLADHIAHGDEISVPLAPLSQLSSSRLRPTACWVA
jgi:hypothetical protein